MHSSYKLYIEATASIQSSIALSEGIIRTLGIEQVEQRHDERAPFLRFSCPSELRETILRKLLPSCRQEGVSYVLCQEKNPLDPKLIAFDMDLTLVQIEIIEELAKGHEQEAKIGQLTREAMDGLIDFELSFSTRLKLLAGLSHSRIAALSSALPTVPGLEQLIHSAREKGICCGIITGGLESFALALRREFELDFAFSSKAELCEGQLTGRLLKPILNPRAKAEKLQQLALEKGIDREQTMAVGDGANDLPMLAAAGVSVLFCARPEQNPIPSPPLSFLLRYI